MTPDSSKARRDNIKNVDWTRNGVFGKDFNFRFLT